MESILLIVTLIVLAAGIALVWRLTRNKPANNQNDQSLVILQHQMTELNRSLDIKLGQIANESKHTVTEVTRQSAKIISDVTEKLTRVDEAARQTLAMNEQIKKLQDTLTNPKQRGILGEYLLETVLKNVLPPGQYQMQYPFADGVIVDAAVFADKKIIPIDSKFSLENYNRFAAATDPSEKKKYESSFVSDIKNRIDETSKYVKPQEDTMDFAFMFIPSEAIYYDLLINKVGSDAEDKNMITYAFQKKVIIVSPTSFLAYLQTVLQGLRNQKISEQAQDIIKQVDNLRKHLINYEEYFGKIGKNLTTTVSAYNHAQKEFGKIDKDVLKITGEAMNTESLAIEGPDNDE
ncbi:MAG: DNA recombination protein RmuC [Patescibacteria group bacterium]|nr:DNA recombination protein RmuC [Patescibacteria group bacterium]MDE2015385.1 DNA recombination protein RmuC [Patescibacteria group bacterium]MDE2227000.1 DNA recombination protein RmuC [Patescibacteria group bacterium]